MTIMGTAIGPRPAAAVEPIKAEAIAVEVAARDVVYDPARDVIYASTDDADPNHPGQIVTIDPRTGAVIANANVGTIPNALAITADGSALYVGLDGRASVQKLLLPTMTPDWSFTFAPYFGYPTTAGDIEIMPGTTDTVAVAQRVTGLSPSHAGIVIIDRGIARPNATGGHIGSNSIAFGAADRLYGSDTESSGRSFFRHSIGPDGIVTIDSTGIGGGTITFHDGLVYSGHGRIVDPSTTPPSLADTLPPANAVAIDAQHDLVYYISTDFAAGLRTIVRAFDLNTRAPRGVWRLPAPYLTSASRLAVVGDGRLAFLDNVPAPSGRTNVQLIDLNNTLLPPGDPGSLGEYTPLTPERILDTRSGLGAGGTPRRLGPGQTIDVPVTGVAGVPATGVDAVVMNVTAVDPTRAGFLTVYPSGTPLPTISNLNFGPGATVANLVTMQVGAGGNVSVHNPYGEIDVLFDVAGFYASESGPDGARFHATSPSRLMDTRDGQGVRLGVVGTGETVTLQVAGRGGVPATGARSVALNVTVTQPTAPSFVTVAPSDVARPTASNINFYRESTIANQVIVRLPADGTITLYNQAGATHLIVDVVGYYDDIESGNTGRFISFRPFRAIDTRLDSPFDPPGDLWPGDILYWGQEDEDLSAHVMNVTVTDSRGLGYLSVYPYSQVASQPPNASTLNYSPGRTVPNHTISATGPYTGFYNAGGYVHLVVDVFGGFI